MKCIFSAEPAITEKLTTTAASPKINRRRFRSFRSRTKYGYVEPTVSIVSAPPKVIKHDYPTQNPIPEDNTKKQINNDSGEIFDSNDKVTVAADHTDAVTETSLMFISAPPQVSGTQEKDFHDFEYENFETGPKALNDDLSGHINVNFEDLGQHSEWIQSVGVPKIQKSQPLKILVINSTTNSTMEHYFDDDIVPKITLILSIIIPIVLVVTGNVNYVRI